MFSQKPSQSPIYVIGAGIAGLACAQKLIDAGKDVIVLEASNRIGGRIKTESVNSNTYDLGASWIHGIQQNPIWDIAQSNNIKTAVFNYDKFQMIDVNGQLFEDHEVINFENYIEQISRKISDLTSTDNLETVLKNIIQNLDYSSSKIEKTKLQKLLLSYFARLANDPFATELADLPVNFLKYEGYFEGDEVIFPQGYQQIIESISNNIPVQLNTQIKSVQLSENEIIIADVNNNKYHASEVVISATLGVLKAGHIEFVPRLPTAYTEAFHNIGFGSFNKIFFELPQPITLKNTQDKISCNSIFYWHNEDCFNLLDLSVVYKKPVYLMLFGGDYSEFIDHADDQKVWNFIREGLVANFDHIADQPQNLAITRWGADEFTLGSFSYPNKQYQPQYTQQLNIPIENKIYFIGEHCSELYAGSVHGAYLSGIETAQKILDLQ
jgi:monoamine oxidase